MSASDYVHLDVTILAETDKAFRVRLDEDHDNQELWLPISQIAEPDDLKVGMLASISITRWIAEKKGIE